jgi:hypothetical protein
MPCCREDDFYAEITTHQSVSPFRKKWLASTPAVPNRKQRLRVVINSFPKSLNEAQWFEEEICPIAAIVYVDLEAEKAMQRTNIRAYSAVRSGHKLFAKDNSDLIKQFRERGNILEVRANTGSGTPC